MTRLFRCLLGLGLSFVAGAAAAADLTVTTLNIRWYGLNGSLGGQLGSERRDATIRAHMDAEGLWTDVIAFQEIVDVDRLARNVVRPGYGCTSYDHRDAKHQHVVICVRQGLRFVKAEDDDFILEDVALGGNHRPAVHGFVTNASGTKLAHVIAVHLKAMPDQSDTRLAQIDLIGDWVAQMRAQVPTVILGDFNTYEDDAERMVQALSTRGLAFGELPTAEPYTFRTRSFANKFDRVFVRGLRTVGRPRVAGACNHGDADVRDRYYREVSDHCAVTVKLRG